MAGDQAPQNTEKDPRVLANQALDALVLKLSTKQGVDKEMIGIDVTILRNQIRNGLKKDRHDSNAALNRLIETLAESGENADNLKGLESSINVIRRKIQDSQGV